MRKVHHVLAWFIVLGCLAQYTSGDVGLSPRNLYELLMPSNRPSCGVTPMVLAADLGEGCVDEATKERIHQIDIGTCNFQECPRKAVDTDSGTYRCCTGVQFKDIRINCSGRTRTFRKITACGCAVC
ncbi:unnamed protein product [Owenia fusiformis]|uniref:Cartilage intermediate layer protein 1/2 domain-containing protein n=1 Tax=Owenia fusiformis TaxID=6347 RepID=A0A8J1TG46_OWEFU|nr:unnamed protein product [Owenia fusiformis]